MFDKIMPLSDAAAGYDLFDKMQAQKVIFENHIVAQVDEKL